MHATCTNLPILLHLLTLIATNILRRERIVNPVTIISPSRAISAPLGVNAYNFLFLHIFKIARLFSKLLSTFTNNIKTLMNVT
jgi:hypothetical protein